MSKKNKSGYHPVGAHILILMPEIRETTEGGILLPVSAAEKERNAGQEGELVAVGDCAWADWNKLDIGTGAWAKVGDIVHFAAWAGSGIDGKDGRKYRYMNDEDLIGMAG